MLTCFGVYASPVDCGVGRWGFGGGDSSPCYRKGAIGAHAAFSGQAKPRGKVTPGWGAQPASEHLAGEEPSTKHQNKAGDTVIYLPRSKGSNVPWKRVARRMAGAVAVAACQSTTGEVKAGDLQRLRGTSHHFPINNRDQTGTAGPNDDNKCFIGFTKALGTLWEGWEKRTG